jgi:hypothetical protein
MSLDVTLTNNACTHCGRGEEDWSQNITHNLNTMAAEGGFYEAVWRPEEVGITHARQLVPILEKAVLDMAKEPERFRRHDSPNGWGLYENFLPWLRRYLDKCREWPDAMVSASR